MSETTMREAVLWEKLEGQEVRCHLCGHHCRIQDGGRGICQVRENHGGILYTLVYDHVIARHVDPIEKKPLFHFLPGSRSYSIATPGCNFHCRHCQNSDISQMPRDRKRIAGDALSPEFLVDEAKRQGCASISYTYTEPTIYFELAYDTARLAQEQGLKNVFVSNGYITKDALAQIRPWLDAANIDLKGFSKEFYQKICGARLDLVLDSIRQYHDFGIWVELTTLIIPGHNDSPEELRELARFIASVDKEIPWHISRFHPAYKLLEPPPTPVATLRIARDIGRAEGLRYVYTGNVPGEDGESTCCPDCSRLLIGRFGFTITAWDVDRGRCPGCGANIPGVGLSDRAPADHPGSEQ